MLEISLSLVGVFAAYTAYTIVGDEIRANRTTPKAASKPPASPKVSSKPVTKAAKPATAASSKSSSSKAKAKPAAAKAPADPVAAVTKAILANLTKNGSVTVAKLTKEINADAATMQLAVEMLVNNKKITTAKRGGYPALTLANK